MKQKVIMLYLLGILFQESFLYGAAAGGFQNFVQQMKSVGETIKEMGESFPTMFWVVPDGYTCSWEVINDSDKEIDIYYQNFISVMGGFFEVSDNSPSYSLHAIQPYHATFSYSLVSPTPIQQASTTSTTTTSPISAPPTSGLYSAIKYYFALFMGYSAAETSSTGGTMQGTNFYKEYQLNLGKKDDKSVSYYHVYTGRRFVHGKAVHMPMVEIAGVYNPSLTGDNAKGNIAFASNLGQIDPNATATTPPAGSVYFYNTTSQPVNLSVNFADMSQYVNVTLEPLSYNLLSCPPNKTLNGSTLSFGGASQFKSIIVPSITIQGNNYIFEIYQDTGQSSPNVAIQGFSPGNYDMCVGSNLRDISPQQAILWIQSVAQKNTPAQGQKAAATDSGAYDLPGQVWMVYQSGSTVLSKKVVLGTPTTLNFMRPTLVDKIGFIYFMYIKTQDDSKSQTFISNFLNGKIGVAIKQQMISTINASINLSKVEKSLVASTQKGGSVKSQENAFSPSSGSQGLSGEQKSPMALSNSLVEEVLSGTLPADSGQFQDPSINITGLLLGVDVFTSFAGPVPQNSYYQLNPAIISMDTLTSILGQFLDSTKIKPLGANSQALQDAINAQVATWMSDLSTKGSDAVKAEIATFIAQYGLAIFQGTAAGTLNTFGTSCVANFVTGSISLVNPPILYNQISVQLPAYTPPAGMPGAP